MSLADKTGYRDTSLGWLPESWECVLLGEVVTFNNGRAYKLSEWESAGTPVIRLQNLTGSGDSYYYSNLELPPHQYAHKGDLLYMWSASFGAHIWHGEKAIYHYHIWKIDCSERVDRAYMFHALSKFTDETKNKMNGSTMLHLTKAGMEKAAIALPPLSEQQKIAAILTAVNDKLDVIARQIEATQTLKQGLMQNLFSLGVGTQDADGRWVLHADFKDSALGTIPAAWGVSSIGSLFEVVERAVRMTDEQTYRRVTVKRRYGGIELRDELRGSEIKVKSQFVLEAGDFLISERQIVHGACGIVPGWLAGALVSNEYLVLKANDTVDVRYFNHLVQQLKYAKYFLLCSQGVDIEKFLFKPKDWLKKKIPLPPLKEQEHIAQVLAAIEAKVRALQSKEQEYQALKRGLMQKLLTGEWRVKVDTEAVSDCAA